MNGKLLLDTNAVVALFRQDSAVTKRLAAATEVFLPLTVVGELHYGAENSVRPDENHEKVAQLAASSSVLFCDLVTARRYGQIKHTLRLKGRPIPENDLWIAAIALQHGLTIISRDQHFSEIEGLSLEGW
jgi:tRNA(fMet)-specific endonuclease VapC